MQTSIELLAEGLDADQQDVSFALLTEGCSEGSYERERDAAKLDRNDLHAAALCSNTYQPLRVIATAR